MTGQVEGVLFTDGENRVFLHAPQPYADGSGYHHGVDLVGGPFSGRIDASSYGSARALHAFHQELVALYQNLEGEARLSPAYANLRLSLKGDGRGHIEVRVEARTGPMMNIRLSFSFAMDQTQLPAVISAAERCFAKPSTSGA